MKLTHVTLTLGLALAPLACANAQSAVAPSGTASTSTTTPAQTKASDPKNLVTSSSDASITPPQTDTRYGVFGALDKRSVYGQGFFPEPFLVDDSDGESDEGRLDWLHTGGPNNEHSDNIHGELEKGFGMLTLELETAYERDENAGQIAEGMDNIDLGARYPLYQYVTKDEFVDTTFGVGLEVGLPTHTQISHNFEIVPKIFNDTKIGNFTVQEILGYSTLVGDGGSDGETDGGVQNFEFGTVLGYTIDHDTFAIPGVQQLIPVFEINGARQMNKDAPGTDNVQGDAGIRVNLDTIGGVQPRLGCVFVFPIGWEARQDQSWGIDTSLVFEY